MKMLVEDIKNHQFKRVYLLTGEETYLRNQYKKSFGMPCCLRRIR